MLKISFMFVYKRFFLCLLFVFLLTSCSIIPVKQKKQSVYDLSHKAESIEVDTDDNGAVDVSYGGTNSTTASGARSSLGVAASTHASEHNDGGADEIDRFVEGVTLQTFGSGDATPDVTNGGSAIHRFWQVHQSTSPTITDFDDGDDHSEFSNGDWFVLIVNYTPEIDFSDNSNIEGNANINFTGSASQIVALKFIFEGTQWKCTNLNTGMSTPTNLSVSSIQAAMTGITDADGITLTADQMNQVIVMTGAGDVDIPADQCDSATFNWITVESTGNFLNSVTSNDASDQFILPNGSALTAGNELDCGDGSSPGQITVMCTRAHKLKVTGYMNCTPADGGSAD